LADVLTPEQRRLNMSRVRGKNTKPELVLRRALHARGLRYRVHPREVPGKPDIVLPRHKAVILIHGCFWHGHDCSLFKWPATRTEFWRKKIEGNRKRDLKTLAELHAAGWRVIVIWECALRGQSRKPFSELLDECESFIRSGCETFETVQGGEEAPFAGPFACAGTLCCYGDNKGDAEQR
jgi:DNA mismatch endonuclease (patch repair protein)